MKKTLFVLGTALLLAASSVSAQSISVVGAPDNVVGNFSFRIDYIPPNTTDTYVSKILGSGIKNCTLEFVIRPTNLVLSPAPDEKFVTFARILRENGPSRHRVLFYVKRSDNGAAYRYAAAVKDDGGMFRFRTGFLGNIDSTMQLVINSSDPAGSNNGSYQVFRNGVMSAEFTGIDLDEHNCYELRVGEQFNQSRINASGYVLVDNFVVTEH